MSGSRRSYLCTLALALPGWLVCVSAIAGEPSMTDLEKRFRVLPMESRRLTGPLFWLHGDESREMLQKYVAIIAEGGNGCFTTESRPHSDWLGEAWFRDLAICLEAAKKHDLKMWIFDEKWWPSGEVGGKVPAEYGSKRLVASAVEVKGPQAWTASGYGGNGYVAAVAGRVMPEGIDAGSLIDLAPLIRDGNVQWDVPAGEWSVMKFTYAPQLVHGRYLVDGASRDAVDWYIRTVYQPHYDRFKDEFGKTIVGFFYDEPETHGDWGTEVIPLLTERGADWKQALVAFKFKLAGEEQIAARYAYLDAFAEAWGRAMYGGITAWCHQRGVQSIGHWLEHTNEWVNPSLCAGNMFQVQKYSSMGGIDAVFDQFKWGHRAIRDVPCWQTPKLGSSVTHAYGRPDDVTMVEIFGARGQDLSYPEMKWWTDHMHVSGVSFLIPHSFNPRSPHDTDCPPYFYNNGFEPRWPLYRVFADYTSRLSVMLTGGRHVCPVALLWAGQAVHVGKHILPDGISEMLQDALYDCDWLPTEVFEQDTRINGRELRLRDEFYRALIVPAAEVIPYATLAKAKAFYEAGGTVLGYGLLPKFSATPGKTSDDIRTLREAIWGDATPGLKACRTNAAGGRSYFLPEKPTPQQLQQVLAGNAGIRPTLEVLEGDTGHWLHVLHRVKAGRDLFFITNQNHTGEPRTFGFRITADGHPECWDAMRNEITSLPHARSDRSIETTMTLAPSESVLLVFQPEKRALPPRLEPAIRPLRTIPLTRVALPAPPEPALDTVGDLTRILEECAWVWYPEGDSVTAEPGTRLFRRSFTLPADRKIVRATFTGTADNSFVLHVNGREAGRGDSSPEGWRNPVQLDVAALLAPGTNVLAVSAHNATKNPSPAGLLAQLVITFEEGSPLKVPVDATWKTARAPQDGWEGVDFSDRAWVAARQVAPFGAAPWGRLGGRVTLSPVKADPYAAECDVPADLDLRKHRVYLEMDALAPEEATRVSVNGQNAGGLIARPLRLDVTAHLKPGRNTVRMAPFAPSGQARLRVYSR